MSRLADRLSQIDRATAPPRWRGSFFGLTPPPRPSRKWRLLGPFAILILAVAIGALLGAGRLSRMTKPAALAVEPAAARSEPGEAPSAATGVEGLLQQGRLAAERGDATGAAERLRQAVELDPQRADGWSDLGVVLIRQGELAAGIEALTRAVGLRPESAEARRNLAVALDRQGRERQAARHYRAFVALIPEGRPERREVERRLAEIHAGKGSE